MRSNDRYISPSPSPPFLFLRSRIFFVRLNWSPRPIIRIRQLADHNSITRLSPFLCPSAVHRMINRNLSYFRLGPQPFILPLKATCLFRLLSFFFLQKRWSTHIHLLSLSLSLFFKIFFYVYKINFELEKREKAWIWSWRKKVLSLRHRRLWEFRISFVNF